MSTRDTVAGLEGPLRAAVHSDITAIAPERWEALVRPSFYFSYQWLRARSGFVRGQPRFFLVEDAAGRPLLGTPAYRTDERSHPGYDLARVLEFDDLDDGGANDAAGGAEALARLRGLLKEAREPLRPSLVVCSPALMGGVNHAPELTGPQRRAAVDAVAAALEEQAARDGAAHVAWLYLLEGDDPVLEEALAARGYAAFVIGADCHLAIAWPTVEDYAASFPGNRRRTFRQEMAAFARAGVTVEVHGAEVLGPELGALELQWRHKHGRQATLDETVKNYEGLREHVGARMLVFVARRAGKAVGFTTFVDDGRMWWARFGGFDYTSGVPFLYFNLLFYHPIRVAIERGVETLAFSRTAYETKHSRGCSLRHFLACVRLPADSALLPELRTLDALQRRRFARIGASP